MIYPIVYYKVCAVLLDPLRRRAILTEVVPMDHLATKTRSLCEQQGLDSTENGTEYQQQVTILRR